MSLGQRASGDRASRQAGRAVPLVPPVPPALQEGGRVSRARRTGRSRGVTDADIHRNPDGSVALDPLLCPFKIAQLHRRPEDDEELALFQARRASFNRPHFIGRSPVYQAAVLEGLAAYLRPGASAFLSFWYLGDGKVTYAFEVESNDPVLLSRFKKARHRSWGPSLAVVAGGNASASVGDPKEVAGVDGGGMPGVSPELPMNPGLTFEWESRADGVGELHPGSYYTSLARLQAAIHVTKRHYLRGKGGYTQTWHVHVSLPTQGREQSLYLAQLVGVFNWASFLSLATHWKGAFSNAYLRLATSGVLRIMAGLFQGLFPENLGDADEEGGGGVSTYWAKHCFWAARAKYGPGRVGVEIRRAPLRADEQVTDAYMRAAEMLGGILNDLDALLELGVGAEWGTPKLERNTILVWDTRCSIDTDCLREFVWCEAGDPHLKEQGFDERVAVPLLDDLNRLPFYGGSVRQAGIRARKKLKLAVGRALANQADPALDDFYEALRGWAQVLHDAGLGHAILDYMSHLRRLAIPMGPAQAAAQRAYRVWRRASLPSSRRRLSSIPESPCSLPSTYRGGGGDGVAALGSYVAGSSSPN